MNESQMARRVNARLFPKQTRKITTGYEYLCAWWAFVSSCRDWYESRVDDWHNNLSEYEQRLTVGRDYPGVLKTLAYEVLELRKNIAIWEALSAYFEARNNAEQAQADRAWCEAVELPGDRWKVALFQPSSTACPCHSTEREFWVTVYFKYTLLPSKGKEHEL